MRRALRIAIELLVPSALGALLFPIAFCAYHGELPMFHELEATFVFGYIYAGIPSIVYSVVMEIAISRGLSPNARRFHLLSSVLGGFSAVGIALVIGHGTFRLELFLLFCPVGLIVGLVCGQLLRLVNRTKNEQKA
jgi:hypothetical protein